MNWDEPNSAGLVLTCALFAFVILRQDPTLYTALQVLVLGGGAFVAGAFIQVVMRALRSDQR